MHPADHSDTVRQFYREPRLPIARFNHYTNIAEMEEGYSKVAQLMASFDDYAIFRRFKALNYQNLLYLHAELVHLEGELRELAERDASNAERIYHAKDWWSLSQADDGQDKEQWEKFMIIREKLDKYSKFQRQNNWEASDDNYCIYRRCATQKLAPLEIGASKFQSPRLPAVVVPAAIHGRVSFARP